MNKLLKDAIADAKAVRETALANAKAALEEAFAPKLQSMLSHKIKEEMEEDEVEPEADEEQMEIAKMQQMAGIVSEEGEEEMEDEMPAEDEAPVEDEMPAEEGGEEDFGGEDEMPAEEEEEVTDDELEEILRELEGEEEDEMEAKMEAEDPEEKAMDEEVDLEEIIAALKEEDEAEEKEEMDEDIDLDEITKALKEEEDEEEKESKTEQVTAELNEAYSVIKYLRSKLNEVNLLNAKLLFVNKLFRKGQLTEAQKVKIIETFDRAKNVRETKLIYATLSESLNPKAVKATPKKKMNEGYASAPQKSTKIITESNNLYGRFKTLVDYNKH